MPCFQNAIIDVVVHLGLNSLVRVKPCDRPPGTFEERDAILEIEVSMGDMVIEYRIALEIRNQRQAASGHESRKYGDSDAL